MTTVHRVVRGTAALAALAAIVAGIPAVMLTVLDADPRRLLPDDPWPPLPELPEFVWHRLRWATDTGDIAIYALIALGWAAWLGLLWITAAEIVYQVRNGVDAARDRRAALPPRRWIAALVTAVILLGSTSPATAAGAPIDQPVSTAPRHPPSPDIGILPIGPHSVGVPEATPGGMPVTEPASYAARCPQVRVITGDTLWGLAERHLGDGRRYTEIITLNRDRLTPAGPHHLEPGWALLLPHDATNLPDTNASRTPCDGERTITVRLGDTLTSIAARQLGDPDRWTDIFQINHRQPQPDGRALLDPDLILPGWTFRLPGDGSIGGERADRGPAETGAHEGGETDRPAPATASPPAPESSRTDEMPERDDPEEEPASSLATTIPGTEGERDATDTASDAGTGDATGDSVIELPSGTIVGVSLALSVLTLLALVRRRARARRRLGGDPTLTPAPVPRAQPTIATLADAARGHPDAAPMPDDSADGDPDPQRAWPPPPVNVVAHADDGVGHAVALADVAGLALSGPGAAAAARAVAAVVATADTMHPGDVWVADPTTLIGLTSEETHPDEAGDHLPGATCTPSQADTLARVETEIARRTRIVADAEPASADTTRDPAGTRAAALAAARNADPSQDLPQILVCAQPAPGTEPRWAAVAELGRGLGIHILLFTDGWPAHLAIDPDGTITTTYGAGTELVAGCRAETLTTQEAAEVARLVSAAHTEPADAPPARPDTETEHTLDAPHPEPGEEPAVVVLVLGGPVTVVTADSDEVTELRAGAREVLAYLACHPRGVPADIMAEHLYGDLAPDKQRASLHPDISHARRALRAATGQDADFIVSADGHYRLDPRTVSSDAWSLDDLLTTTRTTTDPDTRRRAQHGLLDWTAPTPDGLARYDWARDLIESWRAHVTHALAALADDQAADPPHAVEALNRALDWDPYAEDLYRRLITQHQQRGHQADARAAYRRLRTRLAELDLEPSPDIERLMTTGNQDPNLKRRPNDVVRVHAPRQKEPDAPE